MSSGDVRRDDVPQSVHKQKSELNRFLLCTTRAYGWRSLRAQPAVFALCARLAVYALLVPARGVRTSGARSTVCVRARACWRVPVRLQYALVQAPSACLARCTVYALACASLTARAVMPNARAARGVVCVPYAIRVRTGLSRYHALPHAARPPRTCVRAMLLDSQKLGAGGSGRSPVLCEQVFARPIAKTT